MQIKKKILKYLTEEKVGRSLDKHLHSSGPIRFVKPPFVLLLLLLPAYIFKGTQQTLGKDCKDTQCISH